MKPMLKNDAVKKCWYFSEGKRAEGIPPYLSGDVTDLWGNVTGLRGDVTGLRGKVTDLSGNVDACEITDEERAVGVDITTLSNKEKQK